MRARLDQYFTPRATALACWDLLQRHLPAGVDPAVYIEPSAGDGAFYDLLPPDVPRIGIDLEPRRPGFRKRDFLAWSKSRRYPNRRTVVVGNPPFGTRGKLAVAFFNHAAAMAGTIAFVVPVIFRKYFIHKQLAANWRLLASQPLGREAFVRSDGKQANINTDFQVWTKLPGARNLRLFQPPEIKHPDFSLWQYNNTIEARKVFDNEFDFAVPCQGWQDYTRRETDARKCELTKQWMLIKAHGKPALRLLKEGLDYQALAIKHTTTTPGFRKGDLVEEYKKLRRA